MKTFRADKVKHLRKTRRLTQNQFAKLVGFSRQTVNMWERGKKIPNSQSLIIISGILKVPAEYFFVREYSSKNNKTR